MAKKADGLREMITSFATGEIPDREYTEQDLHRLCRSLVSRQRNEPGLRKPGSWCLAPNYSGLDSNDRVDFTYMPTYCAVAILTRYALHYPEQVEKIAGFREALKTGMMFSTYRGLMGHGYDNIRGMIDAMNIMSMGEVPRYLNENRKCCPTLRGLLHRAYLEIKQSLTEGKTYCTWNIDYRKEYEAIMKNMAELDCETMWYFAYGSNMDHDQMIERGVAFLDRKKGVLNDYELAFNKIKSGSPCNGFANIIPSKGQSVEGVLYMVPKDDISILDGYEGCPTHYVRETVAVRMTDEKSGKTVKAETYIACKVKTADGLKPTREYLGHLMKGKDYLSEAYYKLLASVETGG